MRYVRFLILAALILPAGVAATFGTVVPIVGGASDIVLDEPRGRLYVINGTQDRLEIYSIPQRRFLDPVDLDSLPLQAAMSRSGKVLYVTCHNSSTLDVIDLDTLTVAGKVSLPARPEGVAVGADERVLITTIGTGPGNSQNVFLVYDPENPDGTSAITSVVVTPPAPQSPLLPSPAGRIFLAGRSVLTTTKDGLYIIGANIPTNTTRSVFVYEVVSATVLRSRTVNSVSSVLSVSPDGSKFMAGLTLFNTETLEVIAQQNLANASYPIPPNTNFNTQQNQGGSVFAPDNSYVYSGFNVAPFTNPPTRPNVAQLMLNDPDNLYINTALQMPENLAGKMVITADGGTLFAISESGFTIIPIGTMNQFPIADLSSYVSLLANDQCGVTADQRKSTVALVNMGRGRITANAQVLQFTATGAAGLGGAGGPGGGQPGGGVVIVLPPGGGTVVGGGVTGFDGITIPNQNTAVTQTAPTLRTVQSPDGPSFELSFNSLNARTLGTVSPFHDFLIQSPEAINIPPRIRVYQNNRDAESRGDVIPVPVGISANEALVDMALDSVRQRLYVANSGMNRIDVFDVRAKKFMAPIKVGQLPRTIALMPDNNTLYVGNTGGEHISIVDVSLGQVVGRVKFPPLPFNASAAMITPSIIAPTIRGPLIMMNNGTLWRVVGDEAVPRAMSTTIGSLTIPAPRTMVATPNGESVLLLSGNGFVYLYDANRDDFVVGRQIFSAPFQGYYGPVAAGPRGQYFLVNGTILNQALTPVGSAGSVVARAGAAAVPRPVSAVAMVNANMFARFAPPLQTTAISTTTATVELVDVNSGNTVRTATTLEGPISISTGGTARVNVDGRTMVVDPQGTTAYVLTASGLSIVPLDVVPPADRPVLTQNGVVNLASLQPSIAPGSLMSVFGRNLAADATANDPPLPTMLGGVCVTLNNRALPMLMSGAGQINAQVPPDLAAGRYPLIVRNLDKKVSSVAANVTVAKYAPAAMINSNTQQAAIFHDDGRAVDKDHPAKRDQRLSLYAVGLGATKGGQVTAGNASPSSPLAVTDKVDVFFGDPTYRQAAIAVEWSGLVPGLVGVYRVDLYVPGDHMRGNALLVTLRIGGVSSPATGTVVPTVAVD